MLISASLYNLIKSNKCFSAIQLALIIAIFSICHLHTDAAPNGPRIEIKPAVSPVFFEAQAVSNKVLTCKALGVKPGMFSQLRWTGPNQKDNWDELSKRHKLRETTRNGHSLELEFQRPTPDDSGTYYCSGNHQYDAYNASVEVRVFNPIKLENCPDRQFVVEGSEQQKITCRITGDSPSVVFSKDGVAIDQHEKRYKWDNDDGLVILGSVDKQDAGQYTIEVTTDLTGDRRIQNINVEVHSKPGILPMTNPNSSVEFTSVEGNQAELKCQVTGNPRPLVYWLDPKLRNVTSVGGYFVNLEKGTLLISRASRVDDDGEFQCVAYNTVGEARRVVTMAVHQRPAIIAFENKTVSEGSEVTLECRATGYPKPVFTIRKHGLNQVPYRIGDGIVTDLRDAEEGGGSPVFVYQVKIRASRSNFGLHYCNATNSAGVSERVGQLTVKHKPDLSQTPPEQRVKLGRNITLTCHIKAFPAPTVSWYADNQQILNIEDNSNVKTSPDGQTHIVTMMPPLGMQNFPRYRCVASNELGQVDQIITPRFTTAPSTVNAAVLEAGPTTIKLQLSVYNDGGDRIKAFKYRAEGVTMDPYNPFSRYPIDKQNETYIEASPSLSVYTIRNLFPFYKYRISIHALNDVGDGDTSDIHVETLRPTRPEPPVIIKPSVSSMSPGFPSEYQDGYVLRWGPPDLDNGEKVTKYIIKYNRVNPDTPQIALDAGDQRTIEQMNERPMYARIAPLEIDQYYRFSIQAKNSYGDSDPASIVIYTPRDKPPIPNHDPESLPWLTEPSTTLIMISLVAAILFLAIIDIVFCLCFQIGASYSLKNCCCPAKANSVMSDKTYTGD